MVAGPFLPITCGRGLRQVKPKQALTWALMLELDDPALDDSVLEPEPVLKL